jgi:4-amino-4-deoxy-L-arabinose transferase-like glycosyltransferase
MQKGKLTILLDKLGVCASALCMVHCLAMPVLLLVGVDSVLRFTQQEWIEWVIIALALLIGIASFAAGYVKHKKHYVVVLFLAGFLLIINGEMLESTVMATVLPVAGSVVIVYAHVQNLHLKKAIFS